jgi:hypothetical protein
MTTDESLTTESPIPTEAAAEAPAPTPASTPKKAAKPRKKGVARVPKDEKQAILWARGAKKPPVAKRTYKDRKAASEKLAPLYTRPISPVPDADPGSKWSAAREHHLLEHVADGGILRPWLAMAGLTYGDVERKKDKDPAFRAAFEEARSRGIDAMADEALAIASVPVVTEEVTETQLKDGSTIQVRKRGDNVYARKLAFYARVELLKRWAPDRYGDRVSLSLTDQRAQAILAARERMRGVKKITG